jgi:D-xylose transport system substrate-binding protein
VSVTVSAAVAKPTKRTGGSADICVLLPDPKSSVRWETQDRPALVAAFKKAGVSYVITNADGSAQKQKTQADQCLANGAKVVILVSLDKGSSIAIEAAARSRDAKVIEYDRQVIGGSAAIYISFDGRAVGVLQGKGVVAGLKAKGLYSKKPVVAELHGGQTDNNSFLFKGGYESILNPLYKNGTLKKGPQQFTPGWDNQKAGVIFEQMLVKTSNNIQGVAAANDGLANAVVVALKAHKLKPIALSGQDATPQGVQNILSGWQTMTVYKRVKAEAAAAARIAIAIIKNKPVTWTNATINNGSRNVPTVFLKPVTITKKNYTLLFKEGFLKRSQVCIGKYKKYCK